MPALNIQLANGGSYSYQISTQLTTIYYHPSNKWSAVKFQVIFGS